MGKHVKSFVTEVKKNRALFVMAMPRISAGIDYAASSNVRIGTGI